MKFPKTVTHNVDIQNWIVLVLIAVIVIALLEKEAEEVG